MNYVEIAKFSSRLEAEAIGHALDEFGIPFLVQGADIGIFGPGHVGTVPIAISLRVPEDRLEEVEELLTCVVKPIDPDELDAAALAAGSDSDS